MAITQRLLLQECPYRVVKFHEFQRAVNQHAVRRASTTTTQTIRPTFKRMSQSISWERSISDRQWSRLTELNRTTKNNN